MIINKFNLLSLLITLPIFISAFSLIFAYFDNENFYTLIKISSFFLLLSFFLFLNKSFLLLKKYLFFYFFIFYILAQSLVSLALSFNATNLSFFFLIANSILIFFISFDLGLKKKSEFINIYLAFFTIIIFLNVFLEFISYNLFRIDLKFLPWNIVYSQISNLYSFGNIDHNQFRIPTIFGMPHKTSFLSSLLLIWWYFQILISKVRNKKFIYLLILSLATNIFCLSTYTTLSLIIAFTLISQNNVKIWIFKYALIFIFMFILFYFFSFKQFSSQVSNEAIFEYLFSGNSYHTLLQNDLFPVGKELNTNLNNIIFFFLGFGPSYQNYDSFIPIIFNLEIGLIKELIPMIGIIAISFFFFFFLKIKSEAKFPILNFFFYFLIFTSGHYALHFRFGICELIFLILGYILGYLNHERT